MEKLKKIKTTQKVKDELFQKWGSEVILVCSCKEWPGHSMWGQYGSPSCPICRTRCEVIVEDWLVVEDGF